MQTTIDNPVSVPAPAGAYSHVARIDVGDGALLFLSGQVALDEDGVLVGDGDMDAQTRCIFDTIGKLLAAHGAGFDDVVNVRTFMTDMDQLRAYGAARQEYLTRVVPTSTTVEVSRLFRPGALLEVEVVATVAG